MVAEFLPLGYGFVLLLSVATCVLLTMVGFLPMGTREKFFTKEFFEKNFPEELKKNEIDLKHGYPDVGSGFYAQKLPHDQWKEINNLQRVHMNFLETITPAVVTMLISGLVYTRITIILQVAYIIGRILFLVGYKKSGPKGRLVGML
jgi:uncharacterized membrane protein YecN with MAPEG domain